MHRCKTRATLLHLDYAGKHDCGPEVWDAHTWRRVGYDYYSNDDRYVLVHCRHQFDVDRLVEQVTWFRRKRG